MFWVLFKLMLRLALLPLMFLGTVARFTFYILVPLVAMKALKWIVHK